MAPMKIAAPSASGVRVAATSGSTPVATSDVSVITDGDVMSVIDERKRHVAPRVGGFAGRHAGDLVAAVGEDQQQRRGADLLAASTAGMSAKRAGSMNQMPDDDEQQQRRELADRQRVDDPRRLLDAAQVDPRQRQGERR